VRAVAGLALLSLVAALAAAAPAAERAARPAPRVKNTAGAIDALAMDGPVVAYDVHAGPGRCNRLFVWDVGSGAGARVRAPRTCEADSTSTGAGVAELAVAGRRLAWVVSLGGNTESGTTLYTALWPTARATPVERKVASALARGDVDCVLEGTHVGGLAGDGDVLAFNVWRTAAPPDPGSCDEAVTRGFLRRVGGRGWRHVAAGAGTLHARAAAAGRVAVVRADGTVALYPAGGGAPTETEAAGAREAALDGGTLAVLTGAGTLDLLDARTGAARRSLPVAAGAAALDLHGGVAVYAAGRALHAVSLASGRDVVLATAPRRVEHVELERAGLVWAYDTLRGGRVVGNLAFLGPAALRGRLRQKA
jgi:hypothetical protein